MKQAVAYMRGQHTGSTHGRVCLVSGDKIDDLCIWGHLLVVQKHNLQL
jgi:hypothetical protein